MEYRTNRRTGDKISIIGLGASSISQAGEKEGIETLKMAFDNGINYFDLAGGDTECFPYYGKLLRMSEIKLCTKFILVRTMKQEVMAGQPIWRK